MADAAPVFCPDGALAYDRSRTVFVPGRGSPSTNPTASRTCPWWRPIIRA